MHSVHFLGGLGDSLRKILKIRYFEIESGGTFCKIHIILNIKQVKSWGMGGGGNSKPKGGLCPPHPTLDIAEFSC